MAVAILVNGLLHSLLATEMLAAAWQRFKMKIGRTWYKLLVINNFQISSKYLFYTVR